MSRLLAAAALLAGSCACLAQGLECNPSAPRTDPGTGFTPFATLERLEVRSGRPGAQDWEWGLGVNTQQAGQFANANLDWLNDRVYDWTLSYSGTGSASVEVRYQGTLLFSRTWASGMDAGNALKLYVKSSAGIAAGNLVTATISTINGLPAPGTLRTDGTGAFSEQAFYLYFPPMSQGFTAAGTVKLTFTGSYPPLGSRLNFIVTAGNIACVQPSAAKLYFVQVDHLNTPRLIADSTGTTVWRNDNTEPFGNSVPDENPSGLGAFEFPLRFPGQYFDKESNLAYNMARNYDAALGRYAESDPIGLAGGLNTFLYSSANPLSFVDPSGLLKCWWVGLVLHCEWGPPAPAGPLEIPGDKSSSSSRSGTSSKEKACTCDDAPYNKYIRCSKLYDYPYDSKFAAINSYRTMYGSVRVQPHGDGDPALSGPCSVSSPFVPGQHWNVLVGSARVGSIAMCECCDDSSGEAKLKKKYRGF